MGCKGRSVFSEDKEGGLGTCMRVDARKGQRSLSVARFLSFLSLATTITKPLVTQSSNEATLGWKHQVGRCLRPKKERGEER
jgi:hypothetical protein